jgi:hypothetical protein
MFFTYQCCGSGFNGFLDPYPDPQSGSRGAKITHKQRKKLIIYYFLKCWMFSVEGCRLLL